MKKAQKVSKTTWLYRHRLKIFMVMFFVLLPAIFIPSMYILKYAESKPVLFEDKKADVVDINDMKIFDITYTITHIRLPSAESTGGYYRFNYELTKLPSVNQVTNVKIQFQLSTRWAKYTEVSTTQAVTFNQEKTVQMNFNYDMDTPILPFVEATGPYLYAKISYDEMILGTSYARVIYVRLPYDLVRHNTQIIPA